MSVPGLEADFDHALVDHLLTYRKPDAATTAIMETLRADFVGLGHQIVDLVPRTSDRTVALRSLHRACMDTIAALALNAEEDHG